MADLKLIAEGLDFYTIDQITSEDAGGNNDMENMQDRRLDTSWKASSTALQNIDIDMGAGYSATTPYVFLYHNISDNSGTATIKVYKEDENDGTWDGGFTQSGSTFTITSGNSPYAFITLALISSQRYFRIEIDNSDVAPEVYLIFMGIKMEATTGITIQYKFNQSEEKIYGGNKIVESLGGIRAARQYHSGRDRFEYAWDHLDVTNEGRLQSLIEDTKGSALPFFMQDIDSDYHYVRLMNNRIGSRQSSHQAFNIPTLIFEEEL